MARLKDKETSCEGEGNRGKWKVMMGITISLTVQSSLDILRKIGLVLGQGIPCHELH